MARTPYLFAAVLVLLLAELQQSCWGASTPYYGKLIGKLSQLHHGVSGEVYAVDARTLFIKDFTYDGEAPAAFFLAGNSKSVGQNGFQLRDERGSLNELKRYRKKDITLSLPEGKTLANVKWFSVWCEEFKVNFGDVKIPRNFDYPRPQKLGALSGVHGVSSEPVVVVDAQTLLVPSFSYDGEAPDAKFWVGAGPNPSPQGIRVADENGKEIPLRRYDRKTIVLTLPGDLTVHQIGHFGVWCEAFTVDFGHVKIPENLSVPPSLKMLGISPQSKLNCEVLDDELAFEVRWAVAGESIVVQLVSKLEPNEYMSFGLSADPNRSIMVGGDIVVAWVDKQTINGYAVDYFLDAKSQCAGTRGSCPDVKIQQDTDSVRLLNAAMVNGYSIVTYQRPLAASDELDVSILTNGTQAIIWGIGPLNDKGEVGFHTKYLKTNRLFDFGRPPAWNCPLPEVHEQRHASEIGPQPQQTVQPQVQQQPQLQQLQQQPLPAQQHQQYLQEEHPLQDDQVLQQPRRQPPAQEPHRRQQQQSQQLQEEPAQPAQQQQSQPQQHHSRRPQQQQQQQHHQEVQQQEQPSSPPPRRGGGHRRNQHRHQTTQAPQTQVQQTQQVQQVQQQVQPQVQQQVEQQQHQQSDRDAYYLENTQRVAPTTRRPPRIQATPAPAPRTDAWEIPPIQCYEPEDGVFYAQMGPTGGKHGYPAITGHVGWGISWYINGLLIPEIHVVRGKQYTFVVEAGEDPNVPARYHPFYITDDPVGGYFHKTPEERANVSIFAGVRRSRGVIRETGIGRLCNWVHDPNTPEADEFSSFGAFQRTLTLICDPGEPGLVQWIPDENTPDTVYYQCYTHRYLGWKIHVHDTCDTSPQDAASEKHEVVVEPELQQQQQQQYEPQNTDLEVEASLVASPSKVTPSPEFFKLHREYASKDYGDYLRNQAAANHHPSPHHHLHHPHMANAINNHGKLVTDQSINQLMRRPAASYLQLMSHQDRHLANSVHRVPAVVPLSSTSPVVVSTTTSKANLIFNRAKMDNLKMEYVPQTPPAVQVMIVPRRSHNIALKQRPLLMVPPPPPPVQQPQQPSSVIPVSKPPVFYERKKAVYKAPPLPVLPRLQKPPSLYVPAQPYYPTKLVKIDPKPYKIKVEPKPKPQIDSFSSEHKANLLRPMMMKPARNTGFDPGSIVIEKGFKPILRKTLLEDSKSPLDRSSEVQAREEDKEPSKQSQQPNNFEPVFIPSFPDSPIKPTKKKLQKSKLKATDSELVTAAREGVDFAYVHIPSVVSRNPKSHSLNATASSPVAANTTTGPRQNNTIEAKTEPSSKRVKRFPQGPPPGESARDDTHHHHDDEHHHDHHEDHQHHQSTSTGQLILANIEYIVLTVVLYYVL